MMKSKKIYTTFLFFKVVAALYLLVFLAAIGMEYFLNISLFAPLLGVLIVGLLLIIFRVVQLIYGQLDARKSDYEQIEALLGIHQIVKPKLMLPPARGWAASPDFLALILQDIQEHQPKTIVEIGSGLSSVMISEYAQKYDPTIKHYALESAAAFLEKTKKRIHFEGSHIIHAPLEKTEIHSRAYNWYATKGLQDVESIDLLIIDGPPSHEDLHARYPAVHLLFEKLSANATVLLDDADRKGEQEIVELWVKEFNLKQEYIATEKGAVRLMK